MARRPDVVFLRQKWLLRVCYVVFAPFALFAHKISWIVGVEEIALMVANIAGAIDGSYSVVHRPHPFYSVRYSRVMERPQSRFEMYHRLYGPPILLAWLLRRAEGVIYVGPQGFLQDHHDSREFELSFIRRRGRKVVTYWTGNDIRSPRRMVDLEQETGVPNMGTALLDLDPLFGTDEYDEVRHKRAAAADRHSNVIFTARVDQLGYLERPTEVFRYFYPDSAFVSSLTKFDSIEPPIILHAPSNPKLKGTEQVRIAIEQLRAEGYEFEYRELKRVPHEQVIASLKEAHIVLNEFLAFMPGVFGIEALAHSCAVLMSADGSIETDLDPGANDAWIVTRIDEIHDNLQALLDAPERLRPQAERGYAWALAHASASADGRRVHSILAAL